MDMERTSVTTVVKLSRRNLVALLTKLDWASSHCTIERATDAGYLIVIAEPDDKHYKARTPGAMHPRTEGEIDVFEDDEFIRG